MYPSNTSKTNIHEERVYRCQLLGTGAADPTKNYGTGLSVARTGVGTFRVSFANNPGVLIGMHPGFGTGLKGHSVTRSALTAPSGDTAAYVDIALFNASEAADELGATEILDLTFVFSASSLAQ